MKKIVLVLVAVLMVFSVAACGGPKAKSLTLMQNKPEIDAQLKAYAAEWGKKNNVTVVIKSIGGTSGGMGPQLKADYAAGDMPDILHLTDLKPIRNGKV